MTIAANSVRNFKSASGTRNIELLVPFCFRSSCQRLPRRLTNFGSGALAAARFRALVLVVARDVTRLEHIGRAAEFAGDRNDSVLHHVVAVILRKVPEHGGDARARA